MKKSQIILDFLLPADQEPTGTIEPRMRSFDYPTPRPMARNEELCLLFLPAIANMRQIGAALDLLARWCPIIPCIQTQMLRVLFGWIRTPDHEAIQRGTEQADVVPIGPINDEGQGNARPIRQETTLGSLLAAIGGIGSGRGVAERGLGHGSIDRLPFPLNADQLIIVLQSGLPEGLEEASSLPFLKAIMHRRTGSQLARQGIPLDARPQDVDDRLKSLAILHARATSFGMRGGGRDQ